MEEEPKTQIEPKKTVEKSVRQKPKFSDLVTIESPGRIISPGKKEKEKKKKKISRPQAKAETISKGEATLIITEKPQAALKIASALGSARKYLDGRVPFYELERDGKKIIVCSAVGHLFNLSYVKGQTGYPIFKTEWVPSYNKKGASFTKSYYNLIKKLARRSKEIIVATDYDLEGEVIGWNVVRFIIGQENAKRMKYSTLTKNELVKSYENAMPHLDWGQAYAGETRHELDWLYGINLSRALMASIKTSGSFKILSIGRVQGPALKIIVDRDREIKKFKSEPYWQVIAKTPEIPEIDFKHPKDIFNEKELEDFKDIKQAQAKTEKKEEKLSPNFPFDLTSLQREAYNKYRISPSRTLQIAQSLYLDSIISYPRTSSQKIPKEINPKEILKKLEKIYPETKIATRDLPVEGPKSDPAHPSIYPTGEIKHLDGEEKKLYDLIARRFIAAFSPDAKTANKRIVLTSDNGKNFTANGIEIIEKGWLSVYPTKIEERKIPDLKGNVKIEKIIFEEKETQPPKRYTPASLISLMEKKNLGTKSTRSIIVDTLFDRGYIDGKSLEATPLGEKLIESLEKYSPIIIDDDLTRDLEEKMEEIQRATSEFKEKERLVIEKVEKIISDISKDFKKNEREIGQKLLDGTTELREQQKENSTIMTCPVCNKGNLQIRYSKKVKRQFVACDKYPECKNTYSLPPNSLIKKTDKKTEEGLPILVAYRKGKKPWEFTFDPNWKEKNQAN